MIHVTNRPDVAVRLRPLKLRLRHGVTALVILSSASTMRPKLERVTGIEPA